jgi:exodeoxyribonuclease III
VRLRIVVWNCAGGLHRKYERLLALEPSLAIVPECAEPDVLRRKAPGFAFDDAEWTGEQPNKGLGVFAFGGLSMRRHHTWEKRFHIVLPVEVRGSATLNLLAIWAFHRRVPATVAPSPETLLTAVQHYDGFLRAHPSVVAGDFNANVIWDGGNRQASFAELDAALGAAGLASAYHTRTGEALGKESAPTLFWQKNVAQGYHIDYAYVPRAATHRLENAVVGSADEWLAWSDHAPLVVDLDVPVSAAGNISRLHAPTFATP